jgi:hypothetical protein
VTFCLGHFWENPMMHPQSTCQMEFVHIKNLQFGQTMWKLWPPDYGSFLKFNEPYLANHTLDFQVLGLFGKVKTRSTTFMLNNFSFEASLDICFWGQKTFHFWKLQLPVTCYFWQFLSWLDFLHS